MEKKSKLVNVTNLKNKRGLLGKANNPFQEAVIGKKDPHAAPDAQLQKALDFLEGKGKTIPKNPMK